MEKAVTRSLRRGTPLEGHLGFWLRYVSNHVSHAFSLKLLSQGVTVPEWVILRSIYERDEVTPSELANVIGMTRGAVTKIADKLVGRALITRTASEIDRRYQALALTRAGRALVPKLTALADQNDEEFFGHMTPGEREMVESAMKEIVRRYGLRSVPLK